jgi:hypothetical protein
MPLGYPGLRAALPSACPIRASASASSRLPACLEATRQMPMATREHRVIADWIAVTTEALIANTQRVMGLDQAETTVRSK